MGTSVNIPCEITVKWCTQCRLLHVTDFDKTDSFLIRIASFYETFTILFVTDI